MFMYIGIYISGLLPFLAEHKKVFEIHMLGDYSLNILLHPVKNSIVMIEAENPLFFISMGAAFFLFIYIMYKTRTKNYENVGEKYGVQGSSRWAKKDDIFNHRDQILVCKPTDLYADLKRSIGDQEINTRGELK